MTGSPRPFHSQLLLKGCFFFYPLSGLGYEGTEFGSLHDDPGGSGWIRGGTLSLPGVTWPQLMRSRQALCSSPASNLNTDGPRDLIPSLNRHSFHFY